MTSESYEMRSCALCGYMFDAYGMACHTSCPLSAGCHITCCPNCGYQVPDEERTVVAGALKRLWTSLTQQRASVQPEVK